MHPLKEATMLLGVLFVITGIGVAEATVDLTRESQGKLEVCVLLNKYIFLGG